MSNTASPLSDHDVIYTLRTTNQNQTQLNVMADQKANILIGTMGIMMTVFFSKAYTTNDLDISILIPISLFLIMEMTALIFAILVLIPKTAGKVKSKHIKDIKNPLFFGLFTQFPENDYAEFILDNMTDDYSARKFLIHDIYQNGRVLKKKYQLLKLAYLFTLLGILFPAIFFGVFIWIK